MVEMEKGVLALAVLVFAAVLLAGCLSGNFSKEADKLNLIDAKYGVDAENMTPASIVQLDAFEGELIELKAKEEGNWLSADAKALAELISIRLELTAMQRKFLEAQKITSKISVRSPDCTEGGLVERAKNALDSAASSASLALEKKNIFAQNHSGIAAEALAKFEGLDELAQGINESVSDTEAQLDGLCG
ncbi:MAG: hypothetical protein V1494_08320 [Candidatus Diapherotrites archaeon]